MEDDGGVVIATWTFWVPQLIQKVFIVTGVYGGVYN